MFDVISPKGIPLVAVVHDLGSASLSTIRAAAGRKFDIVFVCDRNLAHVTATMEQALQFARVIDVTGLAWEDRVNAVRAVNPSGVVTFSEYRLADTAKLAADLNLHGHSPQVIQALTDKFAQRQAFAVAGVQSTACALVGKNALEAAEQVGFPAVLKPRVGAASLYTIRVESLEQLQQALREFPQDIEFILEALLEGDPNVAGLSWGDYVSVESIHSEFSRRQVCVTGKFPLADPFRETGMFLPSSLSESVIESVLALEAGAVKAIGVRHGVTHTEIKLTSNGPKIIEVNGRLGGYIPEILKRSSGINLVHSALEIAIGNFPKLPPTKHNGICYQFFLTPPAGTRGTFVESKGWSELAAIPGVLQIEERTKVGDFVDYQLGTQSLLGVVYGEAPNHAALREIFHEINSTFHPVFT